MRVLVACEFYGKVREAFRARGHDAWSCDLLAAADGSHYHFRDSIFHVLARNPCGWDLMIAHPPCTYLTCSAEWAYGDGPYHQKVKPETLVGEERRLAREEAIEFVEALWAAPIDRVAIENPIGVLSNRSKLGKPAQVIQPYQFGADASKGTCLWLRGLPKLTPTKHIAPRIVNGKPRWANQTDGGQNKLSPGDDRWALRSLTYPGIAAAMAEQWSNPARDLFAA